MTDMSLSYWREYGTVLYWRLRCERSSAARSERLFVTQVVKDEVECVEVKVQLLDSSKFRYARIQSARALLKLL
jgi:hypothetical protein